MSNWEEPLWVVNRIGNKLKEYLAGISRSATKIPQDIIAFANDYKMYGEKSYVYNNKNYLYALYNFPEVSMNDEKLTGETLNYFIKENKIGHALAAIYGIEQKDSLKNCNTFQEILQNAKAKQAILTNSLAMSAILDSDEAFKLVINDADMLDIIFANNTILNSIFQKPILCEKLGKSVQALAKIKTSVTIMQTFNSASDEVRAKFIAGVQKKTASCLRYQSQDLISSPALLIAYDEGAGYDNVQNNVSGLLFSTLPNEAEQRINVKCINKFVTKVTYDNNNIHSSDLGYPQYCHNPFVTYA